MRRYIELFLGSGIVSRHLEPPDEMIGVEKDIDVIREFKNDYPTEMVVFPGSALRFLAAYGSGREGDVIYVDPPYLLDSTKSQKKLYRYNLELSEHFSLLNMLDNVDAKVIVSNYPCQLYDDMLRNWRSREFTVATRGGPAVEKIWMNYAEPDDLHQYNFLGVDRTDRQRLKRKKDREIAKLKNLPRKERNYLLDALCKEFWLMRVGYKIEAYEKVHPNPGEVAQR